MASHPICFISFQTHYHQTTHLFTSWSSLASGVEGFYFCLFSCIISVKNTFLTIFIIENFFKELVWVYNKLLYLQLMWTWHIHPLNHWRTIDFWTMWSKFEFGISWITLFMSWKESLQVPIHSLQEVFGDVVKKMTANGHNSHSAIDQNYSICSLLSNNWIWIRT